MKRLRQLDAMRGLAALTVIVSHLLASLPAWHTSPVAHDFDMSPLRVTIAGRSAVALFFVLSGFVLALPFFAGRQPSYGAFLIKRFFRIYVPYLAAVVLAFGGYVLLARGPLPEMSSWFNRHWAEPLALRTALEHALLVGSFDAGQYGLVFWTLVHEMRASILFPVMMLPVLYLPTRWSLLVFGVVSAAGASWLGDTGGGVVGSTAPSVSLILALCFGVGALLARHRDALVARFNSLGRWPRGTALAGAWVAIIYSFLLREAVGAGGVGEALEFWGATAGSAVLIVWAVASARVERKLSVPPVARLGDISYSLYLLHALLLYGVVHSLYGRAPILALVGASALLSVPLAYVSFRFVEMPAMAAGRRLAARYEESRSTAGVRHGRLAHFRPLGEHAFSQRVL